MSKINEISKPTITSKIVIRDSITKEVLMAKNIKNHLGGRNE